MDEETPQVTEETKSPRDLRAELFGGLSTQFAAALETEGSLPATSQEALVMLLDSEAPTAAQIIAAASKDPSEEEAPNE